MSDLEEIRSRMKGRRKKKQPLDDSKFKTLYNTMIRFMVILIVALFLASYNKTSDLTVLVNQVVDNKNYQLVVNWMQANLFPFEITKEVSNKITYTSLGDDEFTNYSNQVMNLDKGRVVYTGFQEVMGYYVAVLLENNVQVTYSGLDTLDVELYENVEINQVMGTYQDEFVMLFEYLGESISYEQYLGME